MHDMRRHSNRGSCVADEFTECEEIKMANGKKNTLAINISAESTLHDVETETSPATVQNEEWTPDYSEAREPEAVQHEGSGFKTVRLISGTWEPAVDGINRYGDEYHRDAQFVFTLQDVKTLEEYTYYLKDSRKNTESFDPKDKCPESLVCNINHCSGNDLKMKCQGKSITDLTFQSVMAYWKKFPITVLYGYTQYTDKKSGRVIYSKTPKVQLYWKNESQGNMVHKVQF